LGHVPLPRMSSALTELGPLDIALSALRPGGLLILEEPESHVHPRSLRQLARVLCQASSRWHVMCTTHNDLLLRAIAVETKGQRHASPPVLMSGSATMRGYYEWTSTHRLIDFVDQGPFLDPASDLLDDTLSVFGRELATADGDVG
ncbi:MAG: ATP-binding protein, partial [Candidatus Nanopelagicales bacterium]|nr:ATP-binding protein [Candidatus Nanopelagicales bacterium]